MTADTTNQERTIRTQLHVNGKKVELNDFAQSIIGQTVLGMVRSLRGIDTIRQIRVEVSKSSE